MSTVKKHSHGKEAPQFKVALELEKEFQDNYKKGLGTTLAQVTKMMINFKKHQ